MSYELSKTLDRVPAWREGALHALDEHGPALKRLGREASPAVRLRVAELLLAAGAAGQALDLVRALLDDDLDAERGARLVFLTQRLAARTPDLVPRDAGPPATPLDRMRAGVVRAEQATYDTPHTGERKAGWRAVLDEPGAGGLRADELRFLAATRMAQILLPQAETEAARDLLEQAAALARRYDAPWDEAGLQVWRYLACLQLGDTPGMIEVGRRARELPDQAVGTLPRSARFQIEAVEAFDDQEYVLGIKALDRGLVDARERGDWAGYASIAQSKYLAFELLEQPYFAYRTLKLARSMLRRHDMGEFSDLLARLEQRLERRVGEEAWESFATRLKNEIDAE